MVPSLVTLLAKYLGKALFSNKCNNNTMTLVPLNRPDSSLVILYSHLLAPAKDLYREYQSLAP